MSYEPRPDDRFTIGLWCTAYAGREVFAREVPPPLDPLENMRLEDIAGRALAYQRVDQLTVGILTGSR